MVRFFTMAFLFFTEQVVCYIHALYLFHFGNFFPGVKMSQE